MTTYRYEYGQRWKPKVILAGHDGRQVAELLRQLLLENASRDDFDSALSLILACSGFSPIDATK
jgi:hypothetical protein